MNILKLFVISPIVFALLVGCTSNISKLALSIHENPLDSSCGPRSLSAYSKLTDETGNPYKISDIYSVLDKEAGEPVSMLELKNTAQQLGFEAEGYHLDARNLEGIESYAIIPTGYDRKGSRKDPLHFDLVRFSKGKVFSVDYHTLEETPLKISSLKRIWRGHALLLAQR